MAQAACSVGTPCLAAAVAAFSKARLSKCLPRSLAWRHYPMKRPSIAHTSTPRPICASRLLLNRVTIVCANASRRLRWRAQNPVRRSRRRSAWRRKVIPSCGVMRQQSSPRLVVTPPEQLMARPSLLPCASGRTDSELRQASSGPLPERLLACRARLIVSRTLPALNGLMMKPPAPL